MLYKYLLGKPQGQHIFWNWESVLNWQIFKTKHITLNQQQMVLLREKESYNNNVVTYNDARIMLFSWVSHTIGLNCV